MKALEILKEALVLVYSRQGDDFDYTVCGKIKKAIAELEALQLRSCDGCKYRQHFLPFCGYLEIDIVHSDFCCNRYEPKDNQ